MSNEANMHGHAEVITHHDVHHDEHHVHHHKETFITKYIFSQDHKTIGKQFLITGIVWAIIGGLFSVLFRLQLGFPEQTFPILETFFGRWAAGGVINLNFIMRWLPFTERACVFCIDGRS
jgi:Heme/copper-type cytochrome/quinol oxidases, subunit 1